MKTNPYLLNPYANPYLSRMPNFQMKTPEQYQAELLRQLQPNLDMYNQQYSAYQQQQTMINNSGQYVKVSNYEEVKQVQAPSDGKPIIVIDDTNGLLYSKKFENGQEYIKAFRLVPNEEEKKTQDDVLNAILERLDKLEGKNNEPTGNATEST